MEEKKPEEKKTKVIESKYYGPAPTPFSFKLGEGEATTTFRDKRIVMKGMIYCDFVLTAKYGPQLQIKVVSEEQPKIEKRSKKDTKWSRTEIYLSPKKTEELTKKLLNILAEEWFKETLKEHEIKI